MSKKPAYTNGVALEIIHGALADLEQLRKKLLALQTAAERQSDDKESSLKNVHGRLTEAGVRKLRTLIDAGGSDADIARELEVTPAAVLHQRRRYEADTSGLRRRQ